jgi:hypothetical protein
MKEAGILHSITDSFCLIGILLGKCSFFNHSFFLPLLQGDTKRSKEQSKQRSSTEQRLVDAVQERN